MKIRAAGVVISKLSIEAYFARQINDGKNKKQLTRRRESVEGMALNSALKVNDDPVERSRRRCLCCDVVDGIIRTANLSILPANQNR